MVSNQRPEDRQGIGEFQGIQKDPGPIPGKNVKGPVSEIGHSADAEGQIEAQGHQGQNDAVDKAVDEGAEEHGLNRLENY